MNLESVIKKTKSFGKRFLIGTALAGSIFLYNCEDNISKNLVGYEGSDRIEMSQSANFSLAKSMQGTLGYEPVTWSAETSPINSGRYRPLALGDINNDGYLDIVVGPLEYGIQVWLGDGAGGWTAGTGPTNVGDYHGIALGDVNNDGNLDIVAGMQDGKVDVWLGNGTGGWNPNVKPVQPGGYWVALGDIALGDINNDGNLDIAAVGNYRDVAGYYGRVDVWLGDGADGWSYETGPTNIRYPYHSVELGDINNDGNLDLLILDTIGPSENDYGIEVWLGDGAGSWTPTFGPVDTGVYHIASVGDIDADGDLDIAMIKHSYSYGYFNSGISVHLRNGTRDWSIDVGPTSTGNYYNPVLADINNDGFLDIAAGEFSEGAGGGIDVWFSEVMLPLPASIDIDPDVLNLKSKGKWVSCYTELSEDYDVNNIDVSTVELGTEKGYVSAQLTPTGIGDHDNDGTRDLMLKFDRSGLQNILEKGNEVEIILTGKLTDGRPFNGSDIIKVID